MLIVLVNELHVVVLHKKTQQMKNKHLLTPLFIAFNFFIVSAQVGIGTTNPDSSSMLDINSSTSGLLIPRVNLTSISDVTTIPNPAFSLLVFNRSNSNGLVPSFYYWDSQWKLLGSNTDEWNLSGNSIASGKFLGTTNNQDLVFKVNNVNRAKFDTDRSMTFGLGSNITPGVGNSAVIGNESNVSSPYSFVLGYQSNVSGKAATAIGYQSTVSADNATAIGYQATATQSNSIILGNSADSNNKIGIGTNAPDERLHVAGSIKIVDGTQANNYVLTSDANGKASWKDVSTISTKTYGEKFRTTSVNLASGNTVSFGSNGPSNGVTLNANNITVLRAGVYRVSYNVVLERGVNNGSHKFYLEKNGSQISGSTVTTTGNNGFFMTVTKTALVNLNANDSVSIKYVSGDDVNIHDGTSLNVERIN